MTLLILAGRDGKPVFWDDLTPSIIKVGPKGYIHGWIKVGIGVEPDDGSHERDRDELWDTNEGTANLSDDDKTVIGKAYYNNQAQFTQHVLRYPKESAAAGLTADQEGISRLKQVINSAQPFTSQVKLYQGTVAATKLYGKKLGAKIGQTVSDPGFLSTSSFRENADNYVGVGTKGPSAALITLHTPPGTKALKVTQDLLTHTGNDSGSAERIHEYTLPPSTKLKVLSDEYSGSGKYVRREIHVEVQPDDDLPGTTEMADAHYSG